MNDNQADILLWNAFKGGDREAFDSLFRQYYPLLLQYGARICAEKEILEDCIQELFIETWQSKHATEVQSVKAYLLKSLKYKLYKQLKTRQASSYTGGNTEEDFQFVVSHDEFIIQQEDHARLNAKIIDAISQLPNRQREIVYLKIYQGLSYDEISEIMNINYQASRNLFYQSMKSMRSIWETNHH